MAPGASYRRAQERTATTKDRRLALRKQFQNAAVERWFTQFDKDGNAKLDRSELLRLLKTYDKHLGLPTHPPDDAMLDYLLKVSSKIDHSVKTVKKEALGKVLSVYRDYSKDADRIDRIFRKFDKDNSGFLDRKEVLNLLKFYAREDPGYYPDPEEYDAKLILDMIFEEADQAHSPSGTIAKDEVMHAIATWKNISDEISGRRCCRSSFPCIEAICFVLCGYDSTGARARVDPTDGSRGG